MYNKYDGSKHPGPGRYRDLFRNKYISIDLGFDLIFDLGRLGGHGCIDVEPNDGVGGNFECDG